jgi:hypothetical protein
MIKRIVICGAMAAIGVSACLIAPDGVAAKGFPHAGLHRAHQHMYRPYGSYGYGGPVATYTSGAYAQPVIVVPAQAAPAAAPVPAPHCTHSRETITVPSETGGERQVTITRC